MIITKKALPRRTFLRGHGRHRGAAAARRDGAVDDRAGARPPPTRCAASASSTCRWAATSRAGRRRARARSIELSPTLQSLRAGRRSAHGDQQPGAEERLSRHARDVERVVPERGQGEVDREHRLLPRHDGRSDRRAADRPADAAAVARAVDGPAPDGRPVRQRLRLRLPEQPVVVVADDAAAGRGASAHRVRAAVRRGRQRGRPPRGAAPAGQPARLGARRHHAPADDSSARRIAPGSASISRPCARWSAASRRPKPRRADSPLPDLDRPVGVPAAYADHARLMFDLQVLALQGDVTRVITFQLARETSNRTYPEIGVPDPHHPLTHHGNDPEKIAQDGEDQRVPRVAVRLLPREAEGDAGGQRHAARPLAVSSTAAAWAIPTSTTT